METTCFISGPKTPPAGVKRVRGPCRQYTVPCVSLSKSTVWRERALRGESAANKAADWHGIDIATTRTQGKVRGPRALRAASMKGTSDNLFDRFLSSVRPGPNPETAEPNQESVATTSADPPAAPPAPAPTPAPDFMSAESLQKMQGQAGVDEAVGNSIYKTTQGGIGIEKALENNRKWARAVTSAEPDYFSKLAQQQTPEFLWMGCADSRVPANQILGLAPGEVFVHRNVGNLVTHKDMNAMACLEFSVDVLKVKHVIICGHYNCGAVKGALTLPAKEKGLVNLWISDIRDTRNRHQGFLKSLGSFQERLDRLCELNVVRQMFNVATSPIVQAAWDRGQKLEVHAYVYSLSDGLLKEVAPTVKGNEDLARPQDETPAAVLNRAFSTFSYFEGANKT